MTDTASVATPFTLHGGQSSTFTDTVPGALSVTELQTPGFVVAGITCVDSDPNGVASEVNLLQRTALIRLDPGETVACTFENEASPTALDRDDQPPMGEQRLFLPNLAR